MSTKNAVLNYLLRSSLHSAASTSTAGTGKKMSVSEAVERQIERWRELGVPFMGKVRDDVMWQAEGFRPYSSTDEPLVTGGFGTSAQNLSWRLHSLLREVDDRAVSHFFAQSCRYAKDMEPPYGLRLVHYDPIEFRGKDPLRARQIARATNLRLAGVEVLEYLAIASAGALPFPRARIHLSGIQCGSDNYWTETPYLVKFGEELRLGSERSEIGSLTSLSPVVREC